MRKEIDSASFLDKMHTLVDNILEKITMDNLKKIKEIQSRVRNYLALNHIQALIQGISGGFDSAFNTIILKPVCDELNIPLIGAYIHIETNKVEEQDRAISIGTNFCTEFSIVDLTKEYHVLNETMNPLLSKKSKDECSRQELIQMGNIKARLRMIYLYNLAAKHKGIVIDNDNKTEHMLGFWTIGGDIGDLTPLASYFKTELYEMAKDYLKSGALKNEVEKNALQMAIDAVPTDGLGITSSDVEQFGVSSYNEVDEVLKWIEEHPTEPCPYKEGSGSFKVWMRWKNSDFKRHHPYRILI